MHADGSTTPACACPGSAAIETHTRRTALANVRHAAVTFFKVVALDLERIRSKLIQAVEERYLPAAELR